VDGEYLDITVDRDTAARYGLTPGDVQMALSTAVAGIDVGDVIVGRARYSMLVRYPGAPP